MSHFGEMTLSSRCYGDILFKMINLQVISHLESENFPRRSLRQIKQLDDEYALGGRQKARLFH